MPANKQHDPSVYHPQMMMPNQQQYVPGHQIAYRGMLPTPAGHLPQWRSDAVPSQLPAMPTHKNPHQNQKDLTVFDEFEKWLVGKDPAPNRQLPQSDQQVMQQRRTSSVRQSGNGGGPFIRQPANQNCHPFQTQRSHLDALMCMTHQPVCNMSVGAQMYQGAQPYPYMTEHNGLNRNTGMPASSASVYGNIGSGLQQPVSPLTALSPPIMHRDFAPSPPSGHSTPSPTIDRQGPGLPAFLNTHQRTLGISSDNRIVGENFHRPASSALNSMSTVGSNNTFHNRYSHTPQPRVSPHLLSPPPATYNAQTPSLPVFQNAQQQNAQQTSPEYHCHPNLGVGNARAPCSPPSAETTTNTEYYELCSKPKVISPLPIHISPEIHTPPTDEERGSRKRRRDFGTIVIDDEDDGSEQTRSHETRDPSANKCPRLDETAAVASGVNTINDLRSDDSYSCGLRIVPSPEIFTPSFGDDCHQVVQATEISPLKALLTAETTDSNPPKSSLDNRETNVTHIDTDITEENIQADTTNQSRITDGVMNMHQRDISTIEEAETLLEVVEKLVRDRMARGESSDADVQSKMYAVCNELISRIDSFGQTADVSELIKFRNDYDGSASS